MEWEGLSGIDLAQDMEQVPGRCGQNNAQSVPINCAVFFEKVCRYELFKTESAPRISLVIALSLIINPLEPSYYSIYRQV